MGLFNNETEKKAASDSLVANPESMPAQPVPHAAKPDAGSATTLHRSPHAQTVSTRAYLDQGSKISGKLEFQEPVQIEGQVDGEINAKDRLTIGESAVVTAQIKAASVIVAGKLSGEIIATERIEIRPSAKVSGNLITPILVVHDGAIFEGNCTMQPQSLREGHRPTTLRKEVSIPVQANGHNQP
jgi:cytoskeletal protein CcmA (bactofilin family)